MDRDEKSLDVTHRHSTEAQIKSYYGTSFRLKSEARVCLIEEAQQKNRKLFNFVKWNVIVFLMFLT